MLEGPRGTDSASVRLIAAEPRPPALAGLPAKYLGRYLNFEGGLLPVRPSRVSKPGSTDSG
jgi:hypothetical protein